MRSLPAHVLRAAGRGELVAGAPFAPRPKGVRPSGRSRLQASYAEELELRRIAGEIRLFREEAISLRLATRTWIRPDFLVWAPHGCLEFHEVKGHWEDDARAKLKIAAELHAWASFVAVTRRAGAWQFERLPGPLAIR